MLFFIFYSHSLKVLVYDMAIRATWLASGREREYTHSLVHITCIHAYHMYSRISHVFTHITCTQSFIIVCEQVTGRLRIKMKDFPCVKTCQYDFSTTLATFLMFLNFLFFSCGWHYFIFITPFHIYYIENLDIGIYKPSWIFLI